MLFDTCGLTKESSRLGLCFIFSWILKETQAILGRGWFSRPGPKGGTTGKTRHLRWVFEDFYKWRREQVQKEKVQWEQVRRVSKGKEFPTL